MKKGTASVETLHHEIKALVDAQRQELISLSRNIHDNPEVAFGEEKAVILLTEYLGKHGFRIEKGTGGLKTAFMASYGTGKPVVSLLAEYDALPDIGHACGHNIIAAAASGAGVACKHAVDVCGGTILVIGTPGEEIYGGKAMMVDAGAFADIDAALMVHPGMRNRALTEALACINLDIEFFGKEAHAAAYPDQGINALEAMILAYNGVNSLRQHLREKSRVHGIITRGGEAANVVPAYSAAKFLVRCVDPDYLEELKQKVLDCFTGAAVATGARLEYRWGSVVYAPMNNNRCLARVFYQNLESLGRMLEPFDAAGRLGSTDMGNVSQVVPAIHPSIAIASPPVSLHTPAFAKAAISDGGNSGLMDGASALAMTAADLFYDRDILERVAAEFKQTASKQGG